MFFKLFPRLILLKHGAPSSLYSCASIRKLYGLFLRGQEPLLLNESCVTHIALSLNNTLRHVFCASLNNLFNLLIPDEIYTRVSQTVTSFCYI